MIKLYQYLSITNSIAISLLFMIIYFYILDIFWVCLKYSNELEMQTSSDEVSKEKPVRYDH